MNLTCKYKGIFNSCRECMLGASHDFCCRLECGQHEFCRSCTFGQVSDTEVYQFFASCDSVEKVMRKYNTLVSQAEFYKNFMLDKLLEQDK